MNLETKTAPIFYGGRTIYGLLSLNEAGLIEQIDVIIDNVRFKITDDPEWMMSSFGFTYNDFLRYRQVISLRYKDKLAKDYV